MDYLFTFILLKFERIFKDIISISRIMSSTGKVVKAEMLFFVKVSRLTKLNLNSKKQLTAEKKPWKVFEII